MTNRNSDQIYDLIVDAIRAIDKAEAPLSLNQLSAELGLSPAHFQRVFSHWVGISPKRYQQYLTLEYCKNLLRNKHTTLETSNYVNLSSSSRLYDLFIKWEAMTPGNFASEGHNLKINYAWTPSPFGEALIMGTNKGLCGVAFTSEVGREAALKDMQARWQKASFKQNTKSLEKWRDAAFGGSGALALNIIGTPFQIKVWEALLKIPSGYVTTYSDIALHIGHPKAIRAVGTAVGRNPISWLIPCHRALRKSGMLGGYHWGTYIKRSMLAYEGAKEET